MARRVLVAKSYISEQAKPKQMFPELKVSLSVVV